MLRSTNARVLSMASKDGPLFIKAFMDCHLEEVRKLFSNCQFVAEEDLQDVLEVAFSHQGVVDMLLRRVLQPVAAAEQRPAAAFVSEALEDSEESGAASAAAVPAALAAAAAGRVQQPSELAAALAKPNAPGAARVLGNSLLLSSMGILVELYAGYGVLLPEPATEGFLDTGVIEDGYAELCSLEDDYELYEALFECRLASFEVRLISCHPDNMAMLQPVNVQCMSYMMSCQQVNAVVQWHSLFAFMGCNLAA